MYIYIYIVVSISRIVIAKIVAKIRIMMCIHIYIYIRTQQPFVHRAFATWPCQNAMQLGSEPRGPCFFFYLFADEFIASRQFHMEHVPPCRHRIYLLHPTTTYCKSWFSVAIFNYWRVNHSKSTCLFLKWWRFNQYSPFRWPSQILDGWWALNCDFWCWINLKENKHLIEYIYIYT